MFISLNLHVSKPEDVNAFNSPSCCSPMPKLREGEQLQQLRELMLCMMCATMQASLHYCNKAKLSVCTCCIYFMDRSMIHRGGVGRAGLMAACLLLYTKQAGSAKVRALLNPPDWVFFAPAFSQTCSVWSLT